MLQSWDTNDVKLRTYFENYGAVKEAFVSYARDGKPRGFGFVVFESSAVADRVVRNKHTIDRREVRRLTRSYVRCVQSCSLLAPSFPPACSILMCCCNFWPDYSARGAFAGGRQTRNAADRIHRL